jgi:hypothetical protein
MSMASFGLVEVNPYETKMEAERLMKIIEEARVEEDKETLRNFFINYTESVWYRLWNFGYKHWWKPIPKHELTNEKMGELLNSLNPWGWKSDLQFYQYKMLERVVSLADAALGKSGRAEDKPMYLNEYHIKALTDPEFGYYDYH